MVQDSVFMRALRGEPVPRTPAWIMRQAGRYLPEYRETRAKAGNFLALCQNPELACEVTLQPLRRFPLDAAILFSDILTIPDAFGLGLYFAEGDGPRFRKTLDTPEALKHLPEADVMHSLQYVYEAAAKIRARMPAELPLIGFSGSPWTLACYMIDDRVGKDFARAFFWLYNHPEALTELIAKLTDAIVLYLSLQIQAGVDLVMLFDTWGGLLPFEAYKKYSLASMQEIMTRLKALHPGIPIIMFTKDGGVWLKNIAESGADVIGLDWTTSLGEARKIVQGRAALQGNLDPRVLLSNPARIADEVRRVLADYGHGSGHIFNLGHGITPKVPPEHLALVLETLASESPQYHAHD